MKPNPRQQPTDPQPATPSATLIDVDRTTAAPRRWRHRRNSRIGVLVLVAVAAMSITGCSGTPPSPHATAPTTESNGPTTPSSGPTPTPAARQTVLPFTGLSNPQSLALDAAGGVYVVEYADGSHTARGHVVKLAAGSNTQTVLSFTDLHGPAGVAVDTATSIGSSSRS
jgi:serine/threonine protein kinase, bacterial